MTIESKLAIWAAQPRAFVSNSEREFIACMRLYAAKRVGYGWMQQVIEWEWQSKGQGSWGPEYFEKRIRDMEADRDIFQSTLRALFTHPQIDLGDLVYHVREREGLGWDGPAVRAWSDAVIAANKVLGITK